MKVKKLLPLLLAVLMLVACGKDKPAEDDWDPPTKATEMTQPSTQAPTDPEPTVPVEPTDPAPTVPTDPTNPTDAQPTDPTWPEEEFNPPEEDHVHRFGTWRIGKKGTCIKEGYKIRSCDCGEVETKPYIGEHSFGEWTTQTEATCTQTGVDIRKCTLCDAEETAVRPELGHEEVITPGTPATCTENGVSDRVHCARCEEVIQEAVVIEAAHTLVIIEPVEPTCDAEGRTRGSHCSVCQEVFEVSEVLSALGHMPETLFPQDPTCTEFGLSEMDVCERCGVVLVMPEIIDRLGHTLVDGVCIRCGHTCDHGVDPENPGKIGQNEKEIGTGNVVEGTQWLYTYVTCEKCAETSKIVVEEPNPVESEAPTGD